VFVVAPQTCSTYKKTSRGKRHNPINDNTVNKTSKKQSSICQAKPTDRIKGAFATGRFMLVI
jgi:hypothetical protein